MTPSETPPEEQVSKSQKKRDADALQALGVALAELPRATLQKLELPEPLFLALLETPSITSHGALRRHRQYLGKLMRGVDPAPLYAVLEASRGDSVQHTAWLHRLERYRERLLADDAALSDFIADYPHCDVQNLRQLIRNARREHLENKPPKAYRQLFQMLKTLIPCP